MATGSTFSLSLPWILLTGIIGMFFYWLWTKSKRPYSKYNIPPFPVPPRPFLGHILILKGDLRDKIEDWRRQAGNIFSLDLAGQHNIVISSYEVIKEVLIENADRVPNLPSSFASDLLKEHDKGITGAKDGNWKEQRLVSQAILRDLGKSKGPLIKKIQEEILALVDQLSSFNGSTQDISCLTHASTINALFSIVAGERFQNSDPDFDRFMKLLNKVIHDVPTPSLLTAFPALNSLPGAMSQAKQWTKNTADLDNRFIKAYIKKIKPTLSQEVKPENFIAAYLQEMDKRKERGQATQMDEGNLVAIIRSLYVAGTETISATIMWCLLYMLHNQEVQEKVHREIAATVGMKRAVDISDKPKLPYLTTVIMETQRLACVVPIGQRRQVAKSFVIQGLTFPKGSVVWPNLTSVLHNENIWGDPLKFRPERFISKVGGSLIHPEELVVFSTGARACLGSDLASTELFLYLATLLQRFKFEPVTWTAKLPPLTGDFAETINPSPFQMRCVERRS